MKNKNIDMTPKEEEKLIKSIEKEEGWSSLDKKEKEKHIRAAKYTLTHKKDKNISIRISEEVLEGIKRLAKDNGLPYQTLITSIIQRYLNKKIVDIESVQMILRELKLNFNSR